MKENCPYSKKLFAESLKAYIGKKSVSRVARECGIPQQTLSGYILLQREPTLNRLWILADYFGCSMDELIGRY